MEMLNGSNPFQSIDNTASTQLSYVKLCQAAQITYLFIACFDARLFRV